MALEVCNIDLVINVVPKQKMTPLIIIYLQKDTVEVGKMNEEDKIELHSEELHEN